MDPYIKNSLILNIRGYILYILYPLLFYTYMDRSPATILNRGEFLNREIVAPQEPGYGTASHSADCSRISQKLPETPRNGCNGHIAVTDV